MELFFLSNLDIVLVTHPLRRPREVRPQIAFGNSLGCCLNRLWGFLARYFVLTFAPSRFFASALSSP